MAQRMGGCRGQVAAGAVTAQNQRAAIFVQQGPRCSHTIIKHRRVAVFRGKAIRNRDHIKAASRAYLGTDIIMAVQISDNKPAAMDIENACGKPVGIISLCAAIVAGRKGCQRPVFHRDTGRSALMEIAAHRIIGGALPGNGHRRCITGIIGLGAFDKGARFSIDNVIIPGFGHHCVYPLFCCHQGPRPVTIPRQFTNNLPTFRIS